LRFGAQPREVLRRISPADPVTLLPVAAMTGLVDEMARIGEATTKATAAKLRKMLSRL
jgi:hypothetical protein